MLLEVIALTAEDVVHAQDGGASRIELVSAIELGGLSPERETIEQVLEVAQIPVRIMVRCHDDGFVYTEQEKVAMLAFIDEIGPLDFDGFVIGALTEDLLLDIPFIETVVERAISYGKKITFHRAFDCIKEKVEAAMTLEKLGVQTILTSYGYDGNLVEKLPLLEALQEQTSVEILVGGGVDKQVAYCASNSTIRAIHCGGAVRPQRNFDNPISVSLVEELKSITGRKMMMKKLPKLETIIFDMDGTALNDNKEMDKLLVTYQEDIKRAGVQMIIASGRLDQMVYNYMVELNLDTPIIGSNGGTITYMHKGTHPIFAERMNTAALQKLIDLALETGAIYHIFTLDGLYGPKKEGRLAYYSDSNESKTAEEQVHIAVGEKYTRAENMPDTIKFLLVTEDEEITKQFEVLSYELGLSATPSGPGMYDIMAPGINKGLAVKKLAELGMINLDTTLVFGDNYNDEEMFEVAKYPVVMENADEPLKKYAWDIAPNNNVCGVGQYVLNTLGIPFKMQD